MKFRKIVGIVCLSASLLLTACGSEEIDPPASGFATEEVEENKPVIEVEEVQTSESVTKPEEVNEEVTEVPEEPEEEGPKGNWMIYWYLCGSDLETKYGSATKDLEEMMQVTLPENVQVLIQTGGAKEWQNDFVNANKIQRFLYSGNELTLVDEKQLANMGKQQTLEDFLKFAKENYPAEHKAIIFWNHGGGSLRGVEFDEMFRMDSLTNEEMRQAFSNVYGVNEKNPAMDIIGFDACLMASVDTADAFYGIGNYMVASEEIEPGLGWDYSGFLQDLANNPTMSPLDLSKSICDTYYIGCAQMGQESTITLSVANLNKIPELTRAYENFGKESLMQMVEDTSFYNVFSRTANLTENYGGNTREQGYANMLDLGHFARSAEDILPKSRNQVLKALDSCIEYRVSGPYRTEATGLSFYYSYDGSYDNFDSYLTQSTGDTLKYFYYYGLMGYLPDEAYDVIDSWSEYQDFSEEDLQDVVTVLDMDWEDYPIYISEYGDAVLDIGPVANDVLTSITYELFYYSIEDDIMLSLGNDNDIHANWEDGIFEDNFRGVWGSIDGALCYMELSFEGDNYNEYNVPILLNGEKYNLVVIYNFDEEEWSIQGARRPMDEFGAIEKNLTPLCVGDVITTLHYAMLISDEEAEDFTELEIDTIKVNRNTSFGEMELGDGDFFFMFAMKDGQNNVVYSAPAYVTTIDGDIYLSDLP